MSKSYSWGGTPRTADVTWRIHIPTVRRWIDPDELRPVAETTLEERPEWLQPDDVLTMETFLRELKEAPWGRGDFGRPLKEQPNAE